MYAAFNNFLPMNKFIINDIVTFRSKNNGMEMQVVKIADKKEGFPLASKNNPIIYVKLYFKNLKKCGLTLFYASDLMLKKRTFL